MVINASTMYKIRNQLKIFASRLYKQGKCKLRKGYKNLHTHTAPGKLQNHWRLSLAHQAFWDRKGLKYPENTNKKFHLPFMLNLGFNREDTLARSW